MNIYSSGLLNPSQITPLTLAQSGLEEDLNAKNKPQSVSVKTKGYEVWLDDMRFPVAPETIIERHAGRSNIIKLADTSSISIPQSPDPIAYAVELRIPLMHKPEDWYIHTQEANQEPSFSNLGTNFDLEKPLKETLLTSSYTRNTLYLQENYTNHLKKLKDEAYPFNFIVLRAVTENFMQEAISLKVTLEDYTISQRASQNRFDMFAQLELLSYVAPKVYKGVQSTDASGKIEWKYQSITRDEPVSVPAYTSIVSDNDTLWKVAQRFYSKGEGWQSILRANPNLLATPNFLPMGTKLRLPDQRDVFDFLERNRDKIEEEGAIIE